MTSAFEELGGRGETAAEALARWNALQNPPPSEQQLAEAAAEAVVRQRKHDERFADQYLTVDEQRRISRTLARQLGSYIGGEDAESIP
jgi:hypothetical protein